MKTEATYLVSESLEGLNRGGEKLSLDKMEVLWACSGAELSH